MPAHKKAHTKAGLYVNKAIGYENTNANMATSSMSVNVT